jgi:hypothetical protein
VRGAEREREREAERELPGAEQKGEGAEEREGELGRCALIHIMH